MAKILIVDDDPDVVDASRLLLESKGHQVSGAFSRDEGLQAIKNGKPDLLILDVMMDQPDDGLVMAQELRRGGFTAPILMLTSIGKVTGMQYGKDEELVPVDDFVEKPVEPAVLINKIDALLKQRKG